MYTVWTRSYRISQLAYGVDEDPAEDEINGKNGTYGKYKNIGFMGVN